MSFHVIIPARYASSRLPGKPLAELAGRPMIMRVFDQCIRSGAAGVQVATDDQRVVRAVEEAGGEVVLTGADHASGTDRIGEAAQQLGLDDEAIVVNVQGDEPLVPPAVIDQVAENLAARPECQVATLCQRITERTELFSSSAVKVVADASGHALYFSRAPIPWHRERFAMDDGKMPGESHWWRHIGLYAYRVGLLRRFAQWPPTELERIESLEQLRILENGGTIHVAPACEAVPAGVDTPEDLERMRNMLTGE